VTLGVRLTPLAEEDLISIWLYSFERWGETQADQYLDRLNDAFMLISDHPQIASVREELVPEVRIYSCEQHLIIYTLSQASVEIIRVLHHSMDIGSHID